MDEEQTGDLQEGNRIKRHQIGGYFQRQCKANLEADKKVFAALCEHLKATDSTEQTVIGLQVENEPGILAATVITARKPKQSLTAQCQLN